MNIWILELYDQWFECPVTIGVYTTMEKAQDAYEVLMKQLKEKTLEDPEERYSMVIEPIQMDAFIEAALAWVAG